MPILPSNDTTKGPATTFTGDVYIDEIIHGEAPSRLRVVSVHFTPGAHSAWHKHSVGQYLHVTEGIGLMQERDGELHVLKPGDTVYTPADTWHWHGATKKHFMTHLAMFEVPEQAGSDIEWGEAVADDVYDNQPDV